MQKDPKAVLSPTTQEEIAYPIINFIHDAQKSIQGSVYKLDYAPIVKELCSAAARGVSVTLFVESNPYQHAGTYQATTNLDLLRNVGVNVLERLEGYKETQMHAKFLIADRQKFLLTTMNWDTESFLGTNAWRDQLSNGYTPTRDVVIIFEDPAIVKEAVQWFEATHLGHSITTIKPMLNFGPLCSTRTYIVDHLKEARQTLEIWQQSIQDDAMVDLLIEKQKQGIRVSLVMTEDPFYQKLEGRTDKNLPNLYRLKEAGVEIRRVPPFTVPYIHMKGVLIDGERFLLTTSNFYTTSLDQGFEVSTLIDDTVLVSKLSTTFQQDFSSGAPLN